jgi:hypothetical protein
MTIGAAIEGDRRLRAYEMALRHRDRYAKAAREREHARVEIKSVIAKLEKEEQEWEKSRNGKG